MLLPTSQALPRVSINSSLTPPFNFERHGKTAGHPVAINARGTHLLVRRPMTYDLWEIGSGRPVRSFSSYASRASPDDRHVKRSYLGDHRYTISPDGSWVAAIGAAEFETVDLYRVTQSEPVRSFDCGYGNGCCLTEDGDWLIYGHQGNVHF